MSRPTGIWSGDKAFLSNKVFVEVPSSIPPSPFDYKKVKVDYVKLTTCNLYMSCNLWAVYFAMMMSTQVHKTLIQNIV